MIVVYDLETLKDFFLYVDLDLQEDKFNVFEISKLRNDLPQLLEHLTRLRGQIGFNNLSFDSQVQEYIIRNREYLLELSSFGNKEFPDKSGRIIAETLAYKANETISKSNSNQFPEYWERDISIRQVDLYKIWHFDNKQKITSLKWVQYMIDWQNIEDMPIDHNESVETREKADLIINYCKNDCLSTRRFYEITRGKTDLKLYKGIDRLQLRKDVKKEFGFDCTNFNDVKIGDEINKINYLKSTGTTRKELREINKSYSTNFTFGDCFPAYASFISPTLKRFVEDLSSIIIDPTNKQEFSIKIGDTTHTIAKGGIHSQDKPRLIIPTKDEILRDADVGSQYPSSISKRRTYPRHLSEKWLDGYTAIIEKRVNAKKLFKETKDPKYQSIQDAFKYALNGGSFGKFGEKNNWQYDLFCAYKTTIGNQIEILMLIEKLWLAGINVISSNTDGIVSLFDKTLESTYDRICKEWEKLVGNEQLGKLEFADYSLLAQRSVNDYIAIKMDGTPKHKGSTFTVDHELHKNKSYRIIALALDSFYRKGINPRVFITDHKSILDFCAGIRTKGNWFLNASYAFHGQIMNERLQKTNRYFISNHGVKLVKCNPDGSKIQEDSGNWKATILNKYVEKPIENYDVNYDFYVKKTYEIISEIQPEISGEGSTQLSMF